MLIKYFKAWVKVFTEMHIFDNTSTEKYDDKTTRQTVTSKLKKEKKNQTSKCIFCSTLEHWYSWRQYSFYVAADIALSSSASGLNSLLIYSLNFNHVWLHISGKQFYGCCICTLLLALSSLMYLCTQVQSGYPKSCIEEKRSQNGFLSYFSTLQLLD